MLCSDYFTTVGSEKRHRIRKTWLKNKKLNKSLFSHRTTHHCNASCFANKKFVNNNLSKSMFKLHIGVQQFIYFIYAIKYVIYIRVLYIYMFIYIKVYVDNWILLGYTNKLYSNSMTNWLKLIYYPTLFNMKWYGYMTTRFESAYGMRKENIFSLWSWLYLLKFLKIIPNKETLSSETFLPHLLSIVE